MYVRLIGADGQEISAPLSMERMRHASITHALDKTNGNLRAVAQFARHKRVDTTVLYDDNRRDVGGEIARIIAGN